MAMAVVLAKQIIIMFILAGIGFALSKTGKISLEGNRTIGNILIYVVLPCVIVNSFLVEATKERIIGLAISAVAAVAAVAVSVLCARLFFKKDGIAAFAAAFSNPGFIGVPLILAAIGSDAVFYIAAFIAVINIMQWTYGVYLMTGKKASLSIKSVIKAPFMIAMLIGLVLFFTQIPLPETITKTLGFLTALNAPLAMFSVGVYLAQTKLKKMFAKGSLYKLSLVRLIIIPLITMALLSLIPANWPELKMALLIVAACPVGSNVAIYAQLHNKDFAYAVETVIISTILSLVSIPLLAALAGLFW